MQSHLWHYLALSDGVLSPPTSDRHWHIGTSARLSQNLGSFVAVNNINECPISMSAIVPARKVLEHGDRVGT
jgi:hypothetical protein